jgi:hypothetical protein
MGSSLAIAFEFQVLAAVRQSGSCRRGLRLCPIDLLDATTNMPIHLSALLPISKPGNYKAHLACWNGETQPLDAFARDRDEWDRWNTWRSEKDQFNRNYILSLIDFYPEPGGRLFGGI